MQLRYKLSKLFNERIDTNIRDTLTLRDTRLSDTLKLLGNTARTQIILTPETPWTLYNYIYLEDNTAYGAKYWWENAITVFGPRLYNSLPKYLRDIASVKIEKFKFEPNKFLELIPNEPKMLNHVTASGNNSILDQLTHLRAQGIYQSGGVSDSAMEQS